LGHAPRSGPKVKNGRSSAKDGAPDSAKDSARRAGRMRDDPGGVELDPADAVRRILPFHPA